MTGRLLAGIPDSEEVERRWQEAADALGGHYFRSQGQGLPVVQLRRDDAWITLELAYTDTGFRTRVRAPFHHPGNLSLVITDEGGLHGFLKRLGFVQDIELGRPDFDDRFLARGFPVRTVRALLAPPVVDLIVEQAFLDLRLAQWVGDVRYPRGMAELRIQRSRVVRESRALVGLLKIALALLPRLDPLGPLEEAGFEELAARLARPGGAVADPWRGLTLWDGDPQRREAARRLGASGDPRALPLLLPVLDAPDDTLVATAVEGLAALADDRAIPGLVRLLGRRRGAVGGRSLDRHAAEALEAFGAGGLVAAVDRALAGDPDDLTQAVGAYRDEVVGALMEVLDSYDLEARVEAATALGVLGAREALPLLREKSRAMGLRTRLSEAARAAIDAIESRAALPRPARPPAGADDTLPRPADSGPEGGTTLPRPAD